MERVCFGESRRVQCAVSSGTGTELGAGGLQRRTRAAGRSPRLAPRLRSCRLAQLGTHDQRAALRLPRGQSAGASGRPRARAPGGGAGRHCLRLRCCGQASVPRRVRPPRLVVSCLSVLSGSLRPRGLRGKYGESSGVRQAAPAPRYGTNRTQRLARRAGHRRTREASEAGPRPRRLPGLRAGAQRQPQRTTS